MNTYTCFFLLSIFMPSYLFAEDIEAPTSIFADSDLEHVFTKQIHPPMITVEGGEHKLILTEEMDNLLKSYNPQFKAWKTTDYTESIVESLKADGENSAPFAFIMDINKDDKNDVVIDGFNGEQPEIIAIMSNKDNYQVKHIGSLQVHSDPKALETLNDGVVEHGLNYLLWPNKNTDTPDANIFSVITPQETNIKGELLSDGGLIDFRFEEGELVPYYPKF